jgi:hypothetical protein
MGDPKKHTISCLSEVKMHAVKSIAFPVNSLSMILQAKAINITISFVVFTKFSKCFSSCPARRCPHDRAKSQLYKEGDLQDPFRDLATQEAVRARIRLKSYPHKKADQYARASPGVSAREIEQCLLIPLNALLYPQILRLDPPGLLQGGLPIHLLAGAQILVMNLGPMQPGAIQYLYLFLPFLE